MKIKYVNIIECIFLIVSFGGLIISQFNFPNMIYYIADILNIVLFFFAIRKIYRKKKIRNFKVLNFILFLSISSIVIGCAFNNNSILLELWGMRNMFRFYLFFLSCIVLLSSEDVKTIYNYIYKLFWINFVITLFQFFILKIKGDYLGGIFGTKQGCNSATTIFINIIIINVIEQYLNKKINLMKMFSYIIAYIIIISLAEIKVNFVFLILEVILMIMLSKKSKKTIIFGIISVVGILIGLNLLAKFFPENMDTLFDLKSAQKYMSAEYFGTVTFTRNSLLEVTNKYFFKNNILLYLFGYGIGGCDTSQFLVSPFYEKYGYMNYRQYGTSMVLLQNGYLGLILYFLFFIYTGYFSIKKLKENNCYKKSILVISIFAILDSFYASLLIDSAYFIFFVMSVPYILYKENNFEKERGDIYDT